MASIPETNVAEPAPLACWMASLELATMPTAASAARRHARAVLSGWGVTASDVDSVELVVSELVTNASRHAFPQSDDPSYDQLASVERVELALCLVRKGVVVAVSDRNPLPAVRRDPSVWDEGGRGLLIVESLSSFVDIEFIHERGQTVGKVVRAVVPCPTARLLRHHSTPMRAGSAGHT